MIITSDVAVQMLIFPSISLVKSMSVNPEQVMQIAEGHNDWQVRDGERVGGGGREKRGEREGVGEGGKEGVRGKG